ncbi:hypothetical protein INO08_15800, partial [Staphylococcus aureus]|nr:hypothetical protein [Staphylococcus aureus]
PAALAHAVAPRAQLKAYYMIGLATLITAVTSVWTQLIIKGFEVPVNLQNSIMYAFGSVIVIGSYFHSVTSKPLHHKVAPPLCRHAQL